MLNQLMGRPGRDPSKPLDGLMLADGTHCPGAMFVLVDGAVPKDDAAAADDRGHPSGKDRVTRKCEASQAETKLRLDAARAADDANYREYDAEHSLVVQEGGEELARLAAVARPQSISASLAEIIAWNDVERRDNYECHAVKNIESRGVRSVILHSAPHTSLCAEAFMRIEAPT